MLSVTLCVNKKTRIDTQRHSRWGIAGIAAAVALAAACGGSGAQAAHPHAYDIGGTNMQNTLQPGDVVGADGAVKVRRGSIIAFVGPDSWQDLPYFQTGPPVKKTFVSRVIAVGGDHIVCCDPSGNITLNGHVLHEPYLFPGSKPSDMPFDVTVPVGRLFLMGDHRESSADSRFHLTDHDGTIPESDVVGVVTRILKPPNRIRHIPADT